MIMEDGATNFMLGSLFMHPVSMCCTRITNSFKHGRYSYPSNAFIQHGRFNESCIVKDLRWIHIDLEQDTYLINHSYIGYLVTLYSEYI